MPTGRREGEIETAWADYLAFTLPITAPEYQVRDMRLAFWAGYRYLYRAIAGRLTGDENGELRALLDTINQEILENLAGRTPKKSLRRR